MGGLVLYLLDVGSGTMSHGSKLQSPGRRSVPSLCGK